MRPDLSPSICTNEPGRGRLKIPVALRSTYRPTIFKEYILVNAQKVINRQIIQVRKKHKVLKVAKTSTSANYTPVTVIKMQNVSIDWELMSAVVKQDRVHPPRPLQKVDFPEMTSIYWQCYRITEKGYIGDGKECIDLDECQSSPCGDGGICSNLDGSFQCDCESGFQKLFYNINQVFESFCDF